METCLSLKILALTLAEADGLLQSPKLAFTQTRQARRRLPVREAE